MVVASPFTHCGGRCRKSREIIGFGHTLNPILQYDAFQSADLKCRVQWGIKLSFQFVSWLVFNFTDGAQIANQFGGIMFAWTAVFYIQPVTQATYGHLRRLVFCVLYSAPLTVEYGGKIQNPFNNRLVWAAICKQFVTTLALMQRTAT